ncbi:hypothetical protein BB558_001458 [Smittium angustum]|uniref:U2 snRNP auxiliary factor large subunit n=1 Tax=Smittium angustum TaxID=133377 RepID=A0A2U1JBA5_SMIAN|nr:hypothetical protein BB558_001458 [Smittium angustum]
MENIDISSLRVVDLKKELQARNLSTSGVKADLLKRLKTFLEEENENNQNKSADQTTEIQTEISKDIKPLETDLKSPETDLKPSETDIKHPETDLKHDITNNSNLTQSDSTDQQSLPIKDENDKNSELNDNYFDEGIVLSGNISNNSKNLHFVKSSQQEAQLTEETSQESNNPNLLVKLEKEDQINSMQATNGVHSGNDDNVNVEMNIIQNKSESDHPKPDAILEHKKHEHHENNSIDTFEREQLLRRKLEESRAQSKRKIQSNDNTNPEKMAEELLMSLGESLTSAEEKKELKRSRDLENETGSHKRTSVSRARHRGSRRDSEYKSREVIPLHLRERKINLWDLAPAGFENMSAMEAKLAGLFPPPGQSLGSRNVASFNPAVLQEHRNRELAGKDGFDMDGKSGVLNTQARRLYIGNLPYGINEDTIAAFFNQVMIEKGFATESEFPVVAVKINYAKNYAFVDFRKVDLATMGMGLDGILFQSQNLKIRRPKDYLPPAGQPPDPILLAGGENGVVIRNNSLGIPTVVAETPYKIYVGNIPIHLSDDDVIELLSVFGPLRSFILVKDSMSGVSKGFAFLEYADPTITDVACSGLNGMELGDRRIIVQRASVGSKNTLPVTQMTGQMPFGGMQLNIPQSLLQPALSGDKVRPSRVLQLLNMVSKEELVDDEEYNEIAEDIRDECTKFGSVESIKIPRPIDGHDVPGVGKIFVKFGSEDEASSALRALAGRKFAERTVYVSYITEEDYEEGNF